ncbi:NAD(P)/FAD-dependent oxidoreductase [Streptomyces sp. NBC_00083]|uniref:FAD-dependent oxidoreductase n=1 Tax=Streptomyces sp. NBC_00083 TaxID=2975647 RepID=UPI00224CC1A9|nr:NAD(P)/FAD-dependent oxidoreductase [Streptomyces sp. NBC_00083]MCX5384565.1 FAD-dependent monooxygenase [Streptomyces sp. NBC_00083]
MSENTPRIAIVGAGPGGLLCAAVLRQHGIEATVFERDTSPRARDWGGSLDLHQHTGQAALRTVGLYDTFLALSRPEAQELRAYDHTGRRIGQDDGGHAGHRVAAEDHDDHTGPEIDRTELRDMLLGALGTDHVRWGSPVRAVTLTADGRARITPEAGPTEEFDLVVGADGAWSTVRPLLSDAIPLYTGNTLVETWLHDVDRRHPGLAAMIGPGMMLATDADDPEHVLIGQRNGNESIRVYIGLKCEQDWAEHAGVDPADTGAVRAWFQSVFAGWHTDLLRLLTENEGPFISRPVFRLPYPHTWEHTAGATLLGDAAHLMPPAGQGANLALIDGADLATAIVDAVTTGSGLDAAVERYEHLMHPRGAVAAEVSARALEH